MGPRAGQKLFTLQTLSPTAMPEAEQQGDSRGAAQAGGFSLHAGIDIEACTRCGGKLRVIASIEEPEVIAKILAHLERVAPEQHQAELPLGGAGTAGAGKSALRTRVRGFPAGV